MKIMLDAGHGLQTPGKQALDGTKEYTFNKYILSDMQYLFKQYEGVELFTCHSDSRDVPLQERTDLANRLGCDLYVSMHANAYKEQSVRGIETFIYSGYVSPKEVAVAKRIQANMIYLTGQKDRGLKRANFHVLRETRMDAVLIEAGFMTNPEDLKLLHSVAYRQKIARAVVEAVRDEYGLKLKPISKPAPVVPGEDNYIHRVIVDGKQVGAFGKAYGVASIVETHVAKGAKKIIIERV